MSQLVPASTVLSSQRFQRWGWILLCTLGGTMALGLWWMVREGAELQRRGALFNQVGYQRTLSERLLRLKLEAGNPPPKAPGNRVATASAADADVRLETLRDTIDEMRGFQPALLTAIAGLATIERPYAPDVLRTLETELFAAADKRSAAETKVHQEAFLTAMNLMMDAFQRDTESEVAHFWLWLIVLGSINVVLIGLLGWSIVHALAHANNVIGVELEERRYVRQMMELVQTTSTRSELNHIVHVYMDRLLPALEGAVYLFSPSRDVVEPVASWGDFRADEEVPVRDCWSLRLGKVYRSTDAEPVRCPHIREAAGTHWCIPMLADGETLGMLHLRSRAGGRGADVELQQQRATRLAEGFAVTLANLRLRETLRNQSVRDPLTGVFNRRYMEESLTRELHRADRSRNPVSVILLDLDRFKNLNDTFGHAVGDAVLTAFARFLSAHCRAEDIVCRYGGEEFVLIFPDMPPEVAMERANLLRLKWAENTVDNHTGGRVSATFSAGIAAFPLHAAKIEDLLYAADSALYRAKSDGRNQVVLAPVRAALDLAETSELQPT